MGQLHSLKGNHEGAMKSFAEDVYYSSIEYGPEDVRTSLGYFNLAKVFQSHGAMTESRSFMRMVVTIWLTALVDLVGVGPSDGSAEVEPLPVAMNQVYEVVDMLIDIRNTFIAKPPPQAPQDAEPAASRNSAIAEVELTIALALIHVKSNSAAGAAAGAATSDAEISSHLRRAREAYASVGAGGEAAAVTPSQYDILAIADAAEALVA